MKLTLFNGSPKRGMSNTQIMAARFTDGFLEREGNTCETFRLNKLKSLDEAVAAFKDSEYIMLAFPLYNFAMTAVVKEFIERLGPACGEGTGKKIGFLVQFGFPEAAHARALERYLERLAGMLHCEYLGTVLKGGCNSLSENPEKHGKILARVQEIGRRFGETGALDAGLLRRFSKPEKLTFIPKIVRSFIAEMINRFYWDPRMKKNGVLRQSFARPYLDPERR
jgi:multimeric flavodoxin WrbA